MGLDRHLRGWSSKPLKKPWREYKLRYLRNIAWIEQNCVIPSGKDTGKTVRLRAWQRWILRGTYPDLDIGVRSWVRRVIITLGRKNAKTAIAAFIKLLHIAGPESKQNSEIYSTALSRDQASLVFNLSAKTVRQSQTLSGLVEPKDSSKMLVCRGRGTTYRALSADAKTTLGLSPVLAIHDELGQVQGPLHPLYEAVETAMSAHENPLSIIISTQAPTDADLLSILIDDAKKNGDPHTKLFLWTADESLDPFSEETIRLANPAFGDFQNRDEVLATADQARRMPSREALYRNLILNQRIEVSNPFVSKSVWKLCGDPPEPMGPAYAGLDLSEVSDLTSLELYFPENGSLKSFFWLPEHGLADKSRNDRVPYDVWAKEGHLLAVPGKSISYEHVAQFIVELLNIYNVRKIAFDRYNMRHLKPWLLKAGMSESQVEETFVDFGQGYVSMSPALNTLETLLLNEKIKHGNHPVLTMCAANAVVKRDEAGNRKLDKAKSRGRIDGMVALAMACAVANEEGGKPRVYRASLEDIAV